MSATSAAGSAFVRAFRDNPALARERVLREGQARRRGRWGEALSWAGVLLALAVTAASAWWLSRPQRNPWEARTFLLAVTALYFTLSAAVLTGPAAAAITGERERETWQELLLTRLDPWQVVWAKVLTPLRGGVAVFLTLLPPMTLAFHAGRIPLDHALPLLLVLVIPSLGITCLAFWISSRFRRTRFSMAVAYVLVLLLYGATVVWAPHMLIRGENVWWYLNPEFHASILVMAEPQLSPLARPLLPEWVWCVLFYAGLSALCLWRVARRIAREEPA